MGRGGNEDRGFVYISIPVCGSFTACFVTDGHQNTPKYHKTWKTTSRVILSKGELIELLYGFSQGVVMLVVAVAASTGEGGGEGGGDVGR